MIIGLLKEMQPKSVNALPEIPYRSRLPRLELHKDCRIPKIAGQLFGCLAGERNTGTPVLENADSYKMKLEMSDSIS